MRIPFVISALIVIGASTPAFSGTPQGTLPCTVTEKLRGTAVAEATVCFENATLCAQTDSSGETVLQKCPVGRHEITVAAAGYDTLILPNVVITTGYNTRLEISLSRSLVVNELDRITVSAHRLETKKADQTASVTRLSTFDLENTAGTINDVNRVLQTLPSVVTGGTDFNNAMVVRGGHSRENVFILDGIELDNISHFSDIGSSGGSFGFIDGSLLKSLDFYAGSIPASLPARMSSVIDMTMRDGSTSRRNHQLHLNTSGIGFTTEGPFPVRGSYLFCARYIDTRSVKDLVGIEGLPRFGDAQSKITVPINIANSLSLTSVFSYDNYQENIDSIDQGFPSDYDYSLTQYATGLQWNSVHSLFRNRALLSYYRRNELGTSSLYKFDRRYDVYDEWYFGDSLIDGYVQPGPYIAVQNYRYSILSKDFYRWGDDRSTVQFKDDGIFYLGDYNQIRAGVTASRQRLTCLEKDAEEWYTTYYSLNDHNDPSTLDSTRYIYAAFSTNSTVYDSIGGGYLSLIFNAGAFKTVTGLRADYYRMLRDYGISPRLAASYDGVVLGTFAISGGLYYQQPAELGERIRYLIAPDPHREYPAPPLSAIELERSWQGVISYEKQLPQLHQLVLEVYGKYYDREYPLVSPGRYEYEEEYSEARKNHVPWKLQKPDGIKKSYGFELTFQKKQQNGLYYALGYSLSSVRNQYANGKWYRDAEDVRNHGSLLLGVEFLRRHSISTRIYFSDGKPYSEAFYDEESDHMEIDSTIPYYSKRLDPVASVNLRYNFRFYPSFGTVTGYIEVWNLLNYQPVVRRESGRYGYRDTKALGLIPFLGVTVDF